MGSSSTSSSYAMEEATSEGATSSRSCEGLRSGAASGPRTGSGSLSFKIVVEGVALVMAEMTNVSSSSSPASVGSTRGSW
ncbi:hypothetical protein AGDE_15278 [Angomonas deanei]|nr:hypothetical protein AGDE_15278 [Angomonas deanei]|eukprot:EPY19369.1 hypothetical protein AGDE_15278 [Angomonas deanei]